MEEFSSWRPCLGCFHSSRRSSPTADIKDRNLRKRLQKFCRISTLKSSNAPIGSAGLWSCPNAGSSSAPSHGSIAADGSPRIGRTSTERRSRSCASHQSASCSENSAIRPRSEEHTSELQSPDHLVCRLLLEKKNQRKRTRNKHRVRWCIPSRSRISITPVQHESRLV